MAQPFAGPLLITDASGVPVAGALVYTYEAGTFTPKAVFTTPDLSVAHPNPVPAPNGRVSLFLGGGSYRIRVTTAAGVELPQYAQDNITADSGTGSSEPVTEYAELPVTATAGQTFIPTPPYVPGSSSLSVYQDGILIYRGLDYTETSSAGITLIEPATAGVEYLIRVGRMVSSGLAATAVGYTPPGGTSRSVQVTLADSVDASGFSTLSAAFAVSDEVTVSTAVTLASSLTVASGKRLVFLAGGQLTISSGATLTIAEVEGPDLQIFAGAGAVAGLVRCRVAWFAGSKINTTTDALADIQKAYDACASGAEVLWPSGFFCITGATAIQAAVGQRTRGISAKASKLYYTTAACNGLNITSGPGTYGSVEDLFIGAYSRVAQPTSGSAITAARDNTKISRVQIDGAYVGIEFPSGSTGSVANQIEVRNSASVGVLVRDTNDVFINQFLIVAFFDRVTISSLSGTFTANETVTTNTGKQGQVIEHVNSTLTIVYWFVQVPSAGETMTGATSGATATVDSVFVNHQLGGLRLQNKAEAVIVSDGDVIGGLYPLTTDAASNAVSVRPAYSKFSQVYFDTADNPAIVEKAVELEFVSCWFSNRPGSGLRLLNCDGIRFHGGGAVNCGTHGVVVDATAKRVAFIGFAARGNGTLTANTYDGINFAANTTDFVVQGCTLGGDSPMSFGSQRTGVRVETGTSDRYVISNNLVSGNTSAGVTDNGSGSNKSVTANF